MYLVKKILVLMLGCWIVGVMPACKNGGEQPWSIDEKDKTIAVVLVNHGSRSATWRGALNDLESKIKDSILMIPGVTMVKTAFMEYTEPSLATQLKVCDSMGVSDIIIVPVFLTVSTHSFDDIPTIIGQKEDPQSKESLELEKIQRYTPKANTHLTPLLDFSGIMKQNIARRSRALSQHPEKEGLTLIGYGDATYDKEWSSLFEDIAEYVKQQNGIDTYSYGWCGHLVHYNPDSTAQAIERVLKTKEKALVIPVLLAHDEMFQVKIIGDGIHKIQNHEARVAYQPDAILPDPAVEAWIKTITREFADKIAKTAQVQ
ncbi:MAG: CbiX/SirB N-terminal domain-containing protein [Saprospiraceae bacterium]|nr:CbiX/SirB N-terminal domain-containing protein [Saprospiraceae bacterium]